MPTFSVKPIRLLLQILTADAFIGERDKTTRGQAINLKAQGNCGRLQIITSTGSCVWRLSISVTDAILTLWHSLRTDLREGAILYDSELDRIAQSIASATSDHEYRLQWSIVCPIAV